MQVLARGGMSEAEVRAALTGPVGRTTWGVDLIGQDGTVADISDQVRSCQIEYDRRSTGAHRIVRMTMTGTLDWPNVRVRPWQQIDTARFPQGVFSIPTPKTRTTGALTDVQGYDLLDPLGDPIPDTLVYTTADKYLDAIRATIGLAAVPGAQIRLDGDRGDEHLARRLTWVLNVKKPDTYLMVANDLARLNGYRDLWASPDGEYRSGLLQDLAVVGPGWVFDLTDPATDIVKPSRSGGLDSFTPTNWWRFVNSDMGTSPTEGAGIVTIDLSDGGRKVREWVSMDSDSQQVLVERAAKHVQDATSARHTIRITTRPCPWLGHEDVVALRDPILGRYRCVVDRFTADLSRRTVDMTLEVVARG